MSRLPKPPEPAPSPEAFALVPLQQLPLSEEGAARAQALYAWALGQAQAVVRPSLPERDLLGVWN